MKGKLFTLEKAPFLTLGVSPLIAAFRYYEDLRKAVPPNDDFYHAFTFFLIFLVIGIFSIGLYIGFFISERNIARNLEKTKTAQGAETDNSS
jgi:hypothetical protein